MSRARSKGFTLVELLVVIAILGIISGIAIPSFLGQRRRARMIGDAQANAKVLAMALEARKAENGVYGTAGQTANWTPTGGANSFLPSFYPKGNTKMHYDLTIGSNGITYILSVRETAGGAAVYETDQTGRNRLIE